MEESIEIKAARALLDEGFPISIKTTGMLRFLGKKKWHFKIKALKAGTMIEMGKYLPLIKDIEFKNEAQIGNSLELVNANAIPVSKMIATAILRDKLKIKLFQRVLSSMIMWRLNFSEMASIMQLISFQTRYKDFQITIGFLIASSAMTQKKENEPDITGETIAPGELLEHQ